MLKLDKYTCTLDKEVRKPMVAVIWVGSHFCFHPLHCIKGTWMGKTTLVILDF